MSTIRLVCLAFSLTVLTSSMLFGQEIPQWIWTPIHQPGEVPGGACHFRKTVQLDHATGGTLEVAADDAFEAYINGEPVLRGENWQHFASVDVGPHLVEGENTIAIKVVNRSPGDAGLAVRLSIQRSSSPRQISFASDASWKTSTLPLPKWRQTIFSDSKWHDARTLGPFETTAPWIAPVISAGQLAARTSTTKPDRYDQRPEPSIALVAAETPVEESTRRKKGPLLLKPLEKSFPWLKRNRVEHDGGAEDSKPRIFSRNSSRPQVSNAPQQPQPQEIMMPRASTNPNTTPQKKPQEVQSPYANPLVGNTPIAQTTSEDTGKRFTTQPGFEVEHILGNTQTGSLISATFNEFGQILAGREDGPLLLIVDSDDDNKLDEVRVCCDDVKNCQGILALSGVVFVVGEGPDGTGLYRLTDENHDGKLEQVNSLVLFDVSVKEHGPHGIVLGPDSNLYVSVGNHAKLRGEFAKLSPQRHLYEGDLVPRYEDPGGHAQGVRSPGGFILRTDVHGNKQELFASGLRNAYDLAFNAEGQLFTYDSDMESDRGTNWYRPTRLYHVLPGSEFGWRSGWAKWPEYYEDSVPPIEETDRGSPTGMVFYQHHAYPDKYRNAVFLGDWSEGRILATHLEKKGATYVAETQVFLSGTPLNVTDLEVGPDGSLYFVTGGRATQGGLFRVVWKGGMNESPARTGVDAAIEAPQVNSSWGRQEIATIQRDLGDRWPIVLQAAISDTARSATSRVQALQLAQWVGPVPDADLLLKLSSDPEPHVRQMAAYLMSSSKDDRIPLRLLEMLKDSDDFTRRVACESLVRAKKAVPYEYIEPLLGSHDRAQSWAARRLLGQDDPGDWQAVALSTTDARTFIQAAMTLMVASPSKEGALAVAERAHELMGGYLDDEDFIDLLRVVQLAIIRGELQAKDIRVMTQSLADEFPANHVVMNRELIRILVRLNVTSILDRYFEQLESEESDAERIHLATHLRFLDTQWTTEQKLLLFKYFQPPANAGNSVAGYLQNVSRDLGKGLSTEEDAIALEKGVQFPSAALAAVLRLPEKLTLEQIRTIVDLDRELSATDEVAKRLKVAILAILARDGSSPSMAYLRDVFDQQPARRREVAVGLAEQPQDNWEYLVQSLPLLDGQVSREFLIKLYQVEKSPSDPESYRQVIMTGLRLGDAGADDAVRLLEHWQGFASTSETPPWKEALAAWQRWFEQTYPEEPVPRLEVTATASKWDYDALLKHLDGEALGKASIENGKAVFAKADCAKCHRHGELGDALGPDLSAVGKRFLTKEIVDSIVFPSKVISDQYRAKTIVSADGLSYTGIVGSGGPDELIVLQTDGSKVRIATADVEQTKTSNVSAMPEGLLNSLTLQQITDLVAFLNSQPAEQVTRQP